MSRISKAQAIADIEAIGGHDDRDGIYPIAFYVKMNRFPSFSTMYKVAIKSGECDMDSLGMTREELEDFYDEHEQEINDEVWGVTIEDMRRSILDGDDEYLVTLKNGKRIDVDFGFAGRSGGWLVITRFDNRDFTRFSTEELVEEMNDSEYWTYQEILELHEICEKVQQAVDNRDEEFTYQASFNLFNNVLPFMLEEVKV